MAEFLHFDLNSRKDRAKHIPYGQLCVVDEKHDAVAAVTCATWDIPGELRMMRHYLFPAFDADPGTVTDQEKLETKAQALAYTCPADDATAQPLPEGVYTYESPEVGQIDLQLRMERSSILMEVDRMFTIELGHGQWAETPSRTGYWLGAYGWKDGKLLIDIRTPGGPDTMFGTFTWNGDSLTFDGTGMDMLNGKALFHKV